jgi:hypothetical protein
MVLFLYQTEIETYYTNLVLFPINSNAKFRTPKTQDFYHNFHFLYDKIKGNAVNKHNFRNKNH